MGIDYSDRGVLHKVFNHTAFKPNQSKKFLVRNSAKLLLRMESTALFAKDIIANKLIGKEFHIKLIRQPSASGRHMTKVRLIRTNKPAYRQRGLFHRIDDLSRRFEGDIPHSKNSDKISHKIRKTVFFGAKKGVLSAETVAISSASIVNNKLRQNIRYDMDGIDTGKTVLSAATFIRSINSIRKYAIQHRLKKASYKIHKQNLVNEKSKLKSSKKEYKLLKRDNKLYKKRKASQVRQIRKVYSGNNNFRIKNTKRVNTNVMQRHSFSATTIYANIPLKKSSVNNLKKVSSYTQHRRFKLKSIKNSFTVSRGKFVRATWQVKSYRKFRTPAIFSNKKVFLKKHGTNKYYGIKRFKRFVNTSKRFNKRIIHRNKKLKLKKASYKNQRKFAKNERRLKRFYKPKPLILVGAGVSVAKLTGKFGENIARTAPDNDFVKAISKSADIAKNIHSINKTVKNHRVSSAEKRVEKLSKKSNKLRAKQNKLQQQKKHKSKKKHKPKKKTPVKEKAQKFTVDFIKFIGKFFGSIALPLFIIISFFVLILLLFGGGSENSTYVLGTYNCSDYSMAQAINTYTEIANDFNQELLACQKSSSWKSGLNGLGVNTSSYSETPDEFIFGNSHYFPYDAVYDFDYDKFIAFMCAYTYDFSTDNEDIALWSWKNEYKDVIQNLFDAEYEFKHYYINTSHWVNVDNFTAYPSADEFWFIDSSGITTVSGVKYGYVDFGSSSVPPELSGFTNDTSIHFDLNTGEIKNKTNAYAKTGMFFQNLDYQYTSPSGEILNSFYYTVLDPAGDYKAFKVDEIWYKKTQLYVDSYKFDYAIAKEDIRKVTKNNSENRQAVRDFKQQEYIKECKLYTNVHRKRTFDEAIRYILNTCSNSTERIEFYNTLIDFDNAETYGLHQMYKSSPLSQNFSDIISQGKIYNGFGYDMQQWNVEHCGIFRHDGIDIETSSGTYVYSMIDGKVESIDSATHTITIVSTENLNYWYDNDSNYATKIIYTNVTAYSDLEEGDIVNAGVCIGRVDNYKHCYDNIDNSSASKNYLHITVNIKYGFDWESVDPRFLIYREDG